MVMDGANTYGYDLCNDCESCKHCHHCQVKPFWDPIPHILVIHESKHAIDMLMYFEGIYYLKYCSSMYDLDGLTWQSPDDAAPFLTKMSCMKWYFNYYTFSDVFECKCVWLLHTKAMVLVHLVTPLTDLVGQYFR